MCRGWWLVGQNVQVVVGIDGWFISVQVVVPLLDAPLSQFIYSEEYKDNEQEGGNDFCSMMRFAQGPFFR